MISILRWTLVLAAALSSPSAFAVWKVESNQSKAFLGHVAGAGDVNGDGFSDILVGAHSFDNDQSNEGRAQLYLGSPTGPSLVPAWTREGNHVDAFYGSVSPAGDVNADGLDDVLVGAPGYIEPPGSAFAYRGTAAGLSTSPIWFAAGSSPSDCFGRVASAGDVNGDGFDDVLVADSCQNRAFLYRGSATGVTLTPAWTAESGGLALDYACSVAGGGDIDGDGYDDILVGADDWFPDLLAVGYPGKVFVYRGSALGPAVSPSWILEGTDSFGYFGNSVAVAGDVNGDGFDDILIGAYCYGPGCTGRAYLFLGSASGPVVSPVWTADGNGPDAWFGVPVDAAGDVNGDGFADVLVGAQHGGNGAAFLYLGSPSGLTAASAWSAVGEHAGSEFGGHLASAGDVDADGFDDILIGSEHYTNGETYEGAAYLYRGADLCLDVDHDGYGTQGTHACPAGFQVDCADGDAAVHFGAAEICDGLDNDCSGTTDDAPIPAGSPALVAQASPVDPLGSWGALPGATGYDVVRGRLADLRASGGDFTAAMDACVANDLAGTSMALEGAPAPGDAFFYLVRGVNCGGDGTYDSGAASQQGTRDAEIDASPLACH